MSLLLRSAAAPLSETSPIQLYSRPRQVFVGKIPRDLYEDELVPLFESAGAIWDLRLMMDPLSGQNRGYAFITYCNKDDAQKAVKLVSSFYGSLKKQRFLET